MADYKQFDIIWTKFPFSDKVEQYKIRPAVVISNRLRNNLDNDIIACPITSQIRGDVFGVELIDNMLSNSLDIKSEIRCNKLMTIRKSLIVSKSGEVLSPYHHIIIEKVWSAFDDKIII